MKLRPTAILLPLLLVGCTEGYTPTSPAMEQSVFSLLGGLEVGEALTVSGEQAQTLYLPGGEGGREYMYIPFFASEAGGARLQVEVQGANVQGGEAQSSLSPAPLTGTNGVLETRRPDQAFHERLRERELKELTSVLRTAQARARETPLLSRAGAAVPAVGSLMPLNVSTTCRRTDVRQGRVEAVSQKAIVVADTANPAGGFTRADYEAFAQLFDSLIDPVVTRNFDQPTDIDGNQRSVIFFTRAVNEFSPRGSGSFVAGFFWAGDLFPRSLCPASNEAEMFYMLVPDPEGVVNGNRFRTDFVRRFTPGTIGHEYQHLINAGRRLWINNAEDWEELWLNEGLSHLAEEVLFYAASGLSPRRNVDLDALVASQQILDAVNTYQVQNLLRYSIYLENPKDESLLGVDGTLETRGASWAFLRYAADLDDQADEQLFRALVNSRFAGVENLSRVLDRDPIDLMQDWTVSVFADDRVTSADARFRQPSWHFRSILPVFYRDEQFPLDVSTLSSSGATQLRLLGGGAAFVRISVPEARQGAVTTTSGGRVPPDRLRVSVIRTR